MPPTGVTKAYLDSSSFLRRIVNLIPILHCDPEIPHKGPLGFMASELVVRDKEMSRIEKSKRTATSGFRNLSRRTGIALAIFGAGILARKWSWASGLGMTIFLRKG